MSIIEQYLTIKNWFILNSVFAISYGLGLVLIPANLISSLYGVSLGDGGIIVAQNGGSFLFAIGIILWFGRNDGPSDTQKGIMYGLFITYVIVLILSIIAQINEVNALGWTEVALNLVLPAGWGYVLFRKSDTTSETKSTN